MSPNPTLELHADAVDVDDPAGANAVHKQHEQQGQGKAHELAFHGGQLRRTGSRNVCALADDRANTRRDEREPEEDVDHRQGLAGVGHRCQRAAIVEGVSSAEALNVHESERAQAQEQNHNDDGPGDRRLELEDALGLIGDIPLEVLPKLLASLLRQRRLLGCWCVGVRPDPHLAAEHVRSLFWILAAGELEAARGLPTPGLRLVA
eukprot:scaffold56292_cov54-Phaeocystis_antarctica.AAC.3